MLNNDMEKFVINLLLENLPGTYFYHNHQHTLHVMANAERIGSHEGVTEKEMQLIKAAALWHDTGYILTYVGHEHESCLLAKKQLPAFGFTDADITKICGMIMATMVPQDPHNKLENIIADADLEYLGTPQAAEIAHQLFMELQTVYPALTEKEWNKSQFSFIKEHHYFTDYCKQTNEPQKQLYLQEVKRLVQEEEHQ